jgi:hypothetical protein
MVNDIAGRFAKILTPVSWLADGVDLTVTGVFASAPSQATAVASANERLKRAHPAPPCMYSD